MSSRERLSRISTADAHSALREVTSARIALGRSGGSLPTSEVLVFSLAHAAACDAVHEEFQVERLVTELKSLHPRVLTASSRAGSIEEYLRRPDLGRRLAREESARLQDELGRGSDLVVVVSNGLSAQAAHRQVPGLLTELLPRLHGSDWKLGPIVVVPFARVALQDEIGELAESRLSLILLGERPGLGSPDSLGAYFTFAPGLGKTDADRNCVSNIRPQGLSYADAAETLAYLLGKAREQGLSGVGLKDCRVVESRLGEPRAQLDDFASGSVDESSGGSG